MKVILCSKGERVGGLEGRECEEERGRRARGFCRDDPKRHRKLDETRR